MLHARGFEGNPKRQQGQSSTPSLTLRVTWLRTKTFQFMPRGV
jgi:hypothetical protein